MFSVGVAGFLFFTLPGEIAGALIRKAFPHYCAFVMFAAMTAGIAFLSIEATSAFLLGITGLTAVFMRQIVIPWIDQARLAAKDGDEEAAKRSGQLRAGSVVLNFLQITAIAYALVQLA